MDATATSVAATNGDTPFGIGRLFLADSRIAFALVKEIRHRCLHGVFGVSREDENILTLVLALGLASGTYEGARRVMRTPLPVTGRDCATGALVLREVAAGVAGPSAGATPMFGVLMAAALAGGVALPGLRRAAHAARVAERRAREHRIARYLASRTRVRASDETQGPPGAA